MGQPKKLLVLAGTLLAAATLTALLARHHEPRYQGRPLSYWLRALACDPKARPAADAAIYEEEVKRAVRAIGTNAIPTLMTWLTCEPSPTGTRFATWLLKLRQRPLGRFIPLRPLSEFYFPKCDLAISGFTMLGEEAQPAMPGLAKLASDPQKKDAAFRAVKVLGAIGPPALPYLRDVLTNRAAATRVAAAWLIAELGADAAAADPTLLQCVTDPDEYVATAALVGVGVKSWHNEVVLRAFARALEDPRPGVRLLAVQNLSKAGYKAIPLLLRATRDSDGAVHGQAVRILQTFGPAALTNTLPQ